MIRAATPEDVGAIAEIERAVFEADAWSDSLVDLELIAPGRVVVVAEHEDAVIGYASAAVIADVADLTRIAVVWADRREGVGTALLAALLDAAAERGATRMMLEVADTNESALAFYVVSGFVEIARRHDYYRRGVDAVVMELAPIATRDTLDP
jgi:[ribosomal protein S18]-alanine N-acetyltransferase